MTSEKMVHEMDLRTALGYTTEDVKLIHSDGYYTTVLVDFGDAFEVLTYIVDDGDEMGWSLSNNTGALDTWSEAFHEYDLHLDLYYGITFEEAHPDVNDSVEA